MNITISALDQSLLSGILWNYKPAHTHSRGNGWNGEDLSIFSTDNLDNSNNFNIFAGGRAFEAIVRPYVMRCAGTPISMSFDTVSHVFLFQFRHSETNLMTASTVIFVPFFQHPSVPVIDVLGCTFDLDTVNQTLLVFHDETHSSIHTVKIYPALSHVPTMASNMEDTCKHQSVWIFQFFITTIIYMGMRHLKVPNTITFGKKFFLFCRVLKQDRCALENARLFRHGRLKQRIFFCHFLELDFSARGHVLHSQPNQKIHRDLFDNQSVVRNLVF